MINATHCTVQCNPKVSVVTRYHITLNTIQHLHLPNIIHLNNIQHSKNYISLLIILDSTREQITILS